MPGIFIALVVLITLSALLYIALELEYHLERGVRRDQFWSLPHPSPRPDRPLTDPSSGAPEGYRGIPAARISRSHD